MKPATLIYNPHAGPGDWGSAMERLANYWRQYAWKLKICPTERSGHATELAQQAAAAGHKLVLAAGGDGTLNEVANGLAFTETIMAPLPLGTGNVFARELGLPLPNVLEPDKLIEASEVLAKGRVQRMDMGRTNDGRYWLLWTGAGADGYAINYVEPRTKLFKRFGRAGYAAKVLYHLVWFKGIDARVTVDDEVYLGNFLLINISNCRLFGGGDFRLNPFGVLDDGLFEVWLFRRRRWAIPAIARYMLEVGLENHTNDPYVRMVRGRSIHVITNPVSPYHVDAEPTGETPFRCEVAANALRLLVPTTAPTDLFEQIGEPLAQAAVAV